MGFDFRVSVPALTVFLQGLFGFFSPCVFPLIPLYIGYLSGGSVKKGEEGETVYDRRKVILHTLFFVFGVSFAFFVLGLGVSVLGQFFQSKKLLFARAGGILVIFLGLYQLGVFGTSEILGKERRLRLPLERFAMSPVTAFLMGFTFSFAWTPCVGPALTGVLLMTASAADRAAGWLLIGVYTLGFVLPFLAAGLFTTKLLALFQKHKNVVRYTVKAGGVLMIIMGLMMFSGKMNALTGYLSQISTEQNAAGSEGAETGTADAEKPDTGTKPEAENETETAASVPAIDFTLTDQYGKTHTLSDYKGKTVFLNFWATWCPPCRAEMPDIQKIYENREEEGENALVVLGMAAPGLGREGSAEEITQFLSDNGYTYPVLMDTTGEQFMNYGISSFPTTFMIDRDGNVFGYVSGQLSEDMMKSIIEQTMAGR